MRNVPRLFLSGLAALALLLPLWPGTEAACGPLKLTIAHVNDTHSALEPAEADLKLAGEKVTARLGGFARLKAALDQVRGEARASGGEALFLHAGDAVQGTLYFNVFRGVADMDLLNRLGLDAMSIGNHEFDKGPAFAAGMLGRAGFPLLSANIDAEDDLALRRLIRPWLIVQAGRERVGLVGATTLEARTQLCGMNVLRFREAVPQVRAAVAEVAAQGVDKIIVLSHLGYQEDLALARAVPGIDVIVGGHSHSLLGDAARLKKLGLHAAGPYPTEVAGPDGGRTLVVQAWKWGMQLGVLDVEFDAAGRVAGHKARPVLLASGEFSRDGAAVPPGGPEQARYLAALKASGVARVTPEDAAVAQVLAPYADEVRALRETRVGASTGAALVPGTDSSPGRVIADAYLAAVPKAQLALLLPGGVRKGLAAQSEISLGMLVEMLPFDNTLVEVSLTGREFRELLEQAVQNHLKHLPPGASVKRGDQLFHAAGFRCRVSPGNAPGGRVTEVLVRGPGGYAPLDPAASYLLVTNSYLAAGGDGLAILRGAGCRSRDTGVLEFRAVAGHFKVLKLVQPPAEERVALEPARKVSLLRAPGPRLRAAA